MPALLENQRFERYRAVQYLGSGVSGESYEAEDTVLQRKVTLKLIHPWMILPDAARRPGVVRPGLRAQGGGLRGRVVARRGPRDRPAAELGQVHRPAGGGLDRGVPHQASRQDRGDMVCNGPPAGQIPRDGWRTRVRRSRCESPGRHGASKQKAGHGFATARTKNSMPPSPEMGTPALDMFLICSHMCFWTP